MGCAACALRRAPEPLLVFAREGPSAPMRGEALSTRDRLRRFHQAGPGSDPVECLGEIGDQVLGVFQAD